MADAGEVLMGRFGREFLGAAQILLLVFLMGSHILTFTIMLNTLSSHGACTIVFGIVGLIVCYICTLPRKLGDVSYLAIASFISILSAVIVTMADVGTQRPGDGQIAATMQQSLAGAFLPVTNIVFAYAGNQDHLHHQNPTRTGTTRRTKILPGPLFPPLFEHQ